MMVFMAMTNYVDKSMKHPYNRGVDMRHISAENLADAEKIYELLLDQEGKTPNSYCAGDKGYTVSEVHTYSIADIKLSTDVK